ncbi:MAG: Ig-like domain-containing protein [Prevotella sp.]|jgi:hypothetical protein|nr:Ig-like domain-containing protein [Prevotella sp.]
MKLNKILLSLLVIALSVGFASCGDDDDNVVELTLAKSSETLAVGKTSVIKITKGNGDYTVSSSNKDVADATVDLQKSEVTIEAKAVGSATITVKDKEGKTAPIAVTVKEDETEIVGEWKDAAESIEVEAKDAEAIAKIKEEFEGDGFKSLTLKEDASFTAVFKGADGDETEEGTYTYKDGILALTYEAEEGAESETVISYKVADLKEASLKLEVDETESYKENYPDDEVTKAVITTSFTR